MKKVTLLVSLFSLFISNAQVVIDSINSIVYLENVHTVDLTKKEIKDKADRWVAKAYNDSNNVTRINNEDNILTKGMFHVYYEYKGSVVVPITKNVDYTLDIKFKEGRYKIEISGVDISYQGTSHGLSFISFEKYQEAMIKMAEEYEGFGKKSMLKKANNEAKSRKDYDAMMDSQNQIVEQITANLQAIDVNLLAFVKSKENNDDW